MNQGPTLGRLARRFLRILAHVSDSDAELHGGPSAGAGRIGLKLNDPFRIEYRCNLRVQLPPMNKAFTREPDSDAGGDDEDVALPELPPGIKNYVTPSGYARLRHELLELLDVERPKVVEVVSWAAKNGDRSENGDYLYGKKRLREIDRRIRFLTKRLDIAEVVDPSAHHGHDQIFFGATVTYANERGDERTITIKGIDEADSSHGEVSWIAPISRALLKARVGDEVSLSTPGGLQKVEVIDVRYPAPAPKSG
jgi:transcription elongation factor GreB